MPGPAPPRVLHVFEALDAGVGRHVVDVVRHVPGTHHVALPSRRVGWATDEQIAARLRDAGARLHAVEMRRNPLHVRNLLALGVVRRILRNENVDVVHGHSSIGGALARLATRNVPHVYTPNGVMTAAPVIRVERWLGRRTDRLVAVSESERDTAVALGLAPADRVVVIPNGVDLDPGTGPAAGVRARLGLPEDTPLVGSIGRLMPQKAPERLVEVWADVARSHPTAHFLLVGSGPLLGAVRRRVSALGLNQRWHHLDHVPDGAAVIAELDVFVLMSRYEGLPYVVLEAMRAGVPAVLTDVVGSRDAVEHGVSGVLVGADDTGAAAQWVLDLLADRARATRMGAAARARVADRFDVRAMAARLDALYRELASASS